MLALKKSTLYTSTLLIILCMAACVSNRPPHTLAVPSCPKEAPPSTSMQVPAPPPEIFSRCLREILALDHLGPQISEECSLFLLNGPTSLQPN